MYYWSSRTASGLTLLEDLMNINNVDSVYIATAFISQYAIDTIRAIAKRYNLEKNKIIVIISSEFSDYKPDSLLLQLLEISKVYISFSRNLHAKVYWLRGVKDRAAFGSSNLTNGGFVHNLEFDLTFSPDDQQRISLSSFFEYCLKVSSEVTTKHLEYYKEHSDDIKQLSDTISKHRKKMSALLRRVEQNDDPFQIGDYDLDKAIFSYDDYEVFFNRNCVLNDGSIRMKRKAIQTKLLNIHQIIYPEVKKYGLSCHRDPDHVTSLTYPCEYNHLRVGWLGIRYGKTPKELDIINSGADRTDVLGFQKHACLQFCIGPQGFEINLFFAVMKGAYDRMWLHDHLHERQTAITNAIQKLKGYKYVWVIENDDERHIFKLDDDQGFCDFFRKFDNSGFESYLKIQYMPDHEALTDVNSLCGEILMHFKRILPLYNAMVKRFV